MAIVEHSILTCPNCGTQMRERMPINACLVFHECVGCQYLLRPRAGDCCVFCSFGSVPCPPIQAAGAETPAACGCG
ncbi:MAG: GDCCVxC domain-containing (seleno)protein [Dongiaceae bacterium]